MKKKCKLCKEKIYAKGLCINHYAAFWRKNNPKKCKIYSRNYRQNNLELCRKRTRNNQLKLNNKNRFGGLRFKVLERDNYQCQICKKDVSGKNMTAVHHKDNNKQNNIMRNLITLCKVCHNQIHYSLHSYQYTSKKMKQLWKKKGITYFNR